MAIETQFLRGRFWCDNSSIKRESRSMKKESEMDVEYVQVAIPGEEYERKLYLLAVALLGILEKEVPQEEDSQGREVA
jgi:hypothetical protein